MKNIVIFGMTCLGEAHVNLKLQNTFPSLVFLP